MSLDLPTTNSQNDCRTSHLFFFNLSPFCVQLPNHQAWHAKWELSRNTYTLHTTFLRVLARTCVLSRLISSKISASELRRKLIKSALSVGLDTFCQKGGRRPYKLRSKKKFTLLLCRASFLIHSFKLSSQPISLHNLFWLGKGGGKRNPDLVGWGWAWCLHGKGNFPYFRGPRGM